jgi:hypothetical protein
MRNLLRPLLATSTMLLAALPSRLHAQSGSAAVSTQMSIYLAGGNTYSSAPSGGGGLSPFLINLDPGVGRILRVDASGSATFCPNLTCPSSTPDGPAIGATNLNSSGVISGIIAPTSGFLVGVFLGAGLPATAPTSLNFTILTTEFLSLSGLLLGQQFFIGNGFTSSNQQQLFHVPDGATRL